jgi:hypothetical protein
LNNTHRKARDASVLLYYSSHTHSIQDLCVFIARFFNHNGEENEDEMVTTLSSQAIPGFQGTPSRGPTLQENRGLELEFYLSCLRGTPPSYLFSIKSLAYKFAANATAPPATKSAAVGIAANAPATTGTFVAGTIVVVAEMPEVNGASATGDAPLYTGICVVRDGFGETVALAGFSTLRLG